MPFIFLRQELVLEDIVVPPRQECGLRVGPEAGKSYRFPTP